MIAFAGALSAIPIYFWPETNRIEAAWMLDEIAAFSRKAADVGGSRSSSSDKTILENVEEAILYEEGPAEPQAKRVHRVHCLDHGCAESGSPCTAGLIPRR